MSIESSGDTKVSPDKLLSMHSTSNSRDHTMASLMIDHLRPDWQPNDIIKLFIEEREKIDERGQECKQLLIQTKSALKDALSLRDLYSYVSPLTSQLHSECKNIIDERNDLQKSYDRINNTLSKKEELRNIFRRMPEIKNQVSSILNSLCHSFQSKQGTDTSGLTPLDEYYTNFFVECRRIKDLTSQLELCITSSSTEEYLFYLEEIYRFYTDIREQMMEPVFAKNLQRFIAKADRNYCDLTQHCCTSLVRILRNEIQLFYQIFPAQYDERTTRPGGPQSEPEVLPNSLSQSSTSIGQWKEVAELKKQALNELLSSLCKTFYDHLRPVVIHVIHLETLTELYKLVDETMRVEVSDECFQSVMNMLAEDIQERMVFRTEVYMKESILDYKPSQGDLAYPEKFELVPGGELRDYQSMWYPTVQRTVLALVYLSRVLDPLTFKELAHELVSACYKSLDVAQHLVDESHGGTKIEASLFLSKHSAILVDQLQSYGIDQADLPPPPPLLAE